MNCRQSLLCLALSMLTLSAGAGPDPAGPGSRGVGPGGAGPGGARHHEFKASAKTQEALSYDGIRCPGSILVGTTIGQGRASEIGPVSLSASDCPATLDNVNFFFSNGILTITAANGDSITALYSGTLLPLAGSDLHALSGTFAVTGGTGRFAGARGSGNLQGTEDMKTLKGQIEISGRLSY